MFAALLLAHPAEAPAASDTAAAEATRAAERAWARVPDILKRITPPRFPDRDFVVTQFGAVGDGKTDCTKAFADAIAACHKAGGGRVVVPEGVFLTGPIHLKSGVNLHLRKGATIRFDTDTRKYLPAVFTRYEGTELMNYSPFIYAFEAQNIAITGEGTLDGQGPAGEWHAWKGKFRPAEERLMDMVRRGVPARERVFGEGDFFRPNFIQPCRSRNVLIEGVRIINSPMWVINPVYCTNVIVRKVTVETRGPNTDGCNPDSCTDVLIEDCHFSNGDDCIAIKSGRDLDGRRVNIPSQNIIVRNCTFEKGHGGVTCGSETAGGIRNVFAENCRFDSPDLDMAIRLKTNPARGGYIEDFYVRNCTVQTAKFGIHMTMRYASRGAVEGESIPIIRNIDVRDSTFLKLTRQPIFIEGWSKDMPVTDVTIANCAFPETRSGNTITNAVRVNLINLRTLPQ
ncbi:MAG: glycoside hydrolase family 28 protein [Verrucomicrobiales bacterium]|nr:glycoside hydrolase family 28 protein [Verrucomicrobiales bacterium]